MNLRKDFNEKFKIFLNEELITSLIVFIFCDIGFFKIKFSIVPNVISNRSSVTYS